MSEFTPYTPSLGERQPPKKKFRWWLVLSIFGVPMALIGLAVLVFRVGWTIRENQGRKAMVVELQKLDDEGFATDNETIDERYLGRTSEENTQRWMELFETCKSPEFLESATGVPLIDRKILLDDFADDFDTSPEWRFAEESKRFTQEQAEIIKQIRQLAAEPLPVYFSIYFQSTETLLPEVQSIRDVARIIQVDAQLAIHLKDADRAVADIVTLIELTKNVDAVPFTVSKLVGIALRRMALQALQRAIEVDLLNDSQLQQIDELLKAFCDIGDRWSVILSDEMGTSLPVFVNPQLSMNTKGPIPARGHDAVYYIGLMRRAIAIPSDDWSSMYASALELEAELDNSTKSTMHMVDRILSGVLTPTFVGIAAALINEAQLHRQARVAIAIRRTAHQDGQLPRGLDQLSATLDSSAALTPYGGLPFGYRHLDSTAVLWGFNMTKDMQRTPRSIPPTDEATAASLANRSIVWWFR